ncbi:RNA-3'-phosphate cyclase [Trachipleistophora hominis]|uniref:RNA-3'-phosphate cyclase n=1 Tax=Trachipleistophora hominis TaxID=72359 RepID=L7JUQ9_TRAHO|nr:RNA-3'-phosphate cyclase [Trachipleistophora hominis]
MTLKYPISCYINALLVILPFLKIKIVLIGATNLCEKNLVIEKKDVSEYSKRDDKKILEGEQKKASNKRGFKKNDNQSDTVKKHVQPPIESNDCFDVCFMKKCEDFDKSIDSLPIKLSVMKLFGAEIQHKILRRGFNSTKGKLELVNTQILERFESIELTENNCTRINTFIVSSHLSDFLPKSIRSIIKKNIPDARIDMDRNKDSGTVGLQVLMHCEYFYCETYRISRVEECCEKLMKYIFECILSENVFDDKLIDLVFVCMSLATGVSQVRIRGLESILCLVKAFYPVEVVEKDGITSIVGADFLNIWQ